MFIHYNFFTVRNFPMFIHYNFLQPTITCTPLRSYAQNMETKHCFSALTLRRE